MTRLKNIFLLSTLIYATFLLSGCSDDDEAPPVDQKPAIAEIHIEPLVSVLNLGTTTRFVAIAVDVNGFSSDVSNQVEWSMKLSPPILVSKNDPDFPGLSLAVAEKMGTDDIVATLGGLTTTASVEVVNVTLDSLTVTPVNSVVFVGSSKQFNAEGTYSDGHTQNLTYYVNWTSSNGRLPIDSKGIVTPTDTGPATITADIGVVTAGTELTAELTTSVAALRLDPQAVDLFPGDLIKFNAIAVFADGREEVISTANGTLWDTGDWDIATIPTQAKNNGLFEALNVGETFITYSNSRFDVQATALFGVAKVAIANILITPKNSTVTVGGTLNYTTQAVGTDTKTYPIQDSPDMSYSVGNPNIAYFTYRLDKKGTLIALREGTTTVTATFVYEGMPYNDETLVTVIP